ncbi:hypothetical protein BX600DRAFT_516598 [Xylariales sp. PMI_506]|nr:hypothetical protein BX600DRAFT_516598 [Xylariales sp. PMI_506]
MQHGRPHSGTFRTDLTGIPSLSAPKRVLFLTNSEYGQAGVHIATALTVLELYRSAAEVHVASFRPIEKTVASASEYAVKTWQQARPIVFHRVAGIDVAAAWSRLEIRLEEYNGLRPGFWNTPKVLKLLLSTTCPWNEEEFLQIYDSVTELLEEIKPHVIAIDPAFSPAVTACHQSKAFFYILAPNAIKDFSTTYLPLGELLFRFPALASALPYPVPWYLAPLNVYFVFFIILYIVFANPTRQLAEFIKTERGASLLTLSQLNRAPPDGIRFLVAGRPELEFPDVVGAAPEHVLACGPIVRPAVPVAEADPDPAEWLRDNRVDAIEIAWAIRQLLDQARFQELDPSLHNLQVHWKLTKRGNYSSEDQGSRVYDILHKEIRNDKVRIISWLHPEPSSILAEENVICSVHHGGANSFHEAAN